MKSRIKFFGGIKESLARDIVENLNTLSIDQDLDIDFYFDTTIPEQKNNC